MKVVYKLAKLTDDIMIDISEILIIEKDKLDCFKPDEPYGTSIVFKNGKTRFIYMSVEEVYKKLYE